MTFLFDLERAVKSSTDKKTTDAIIKKMIKENKKLSKYKTEKGIKNFFINSLLENVYINYDLFKCYSSNFGYYYDEIDLISFQEFQNIIYSGNFNNEKYGEKVFLKDKSEIKIHDFNNYFDDMNNELTKKYNTVALMINQDFSDYIAKKINAPQKNAKKTRSLKEQSESVIDLLKDKYDEPSILDGSNWLEHLNGSIENSLKTCLKNNEKRRLTNRVKLIYRSKETIGKMTRYNGLLLIDNEDQRVITAALNLDTELSIEKLLENEINEKTTYDVSEIIESGNNSFIIKIKDKPVYKSLIDLKEKLNKDKSLLFGFVNFELSLGHDEVILSFYGSPHRNNIDFKTKLLPKIEEEIKMIGTCIYIGNQTGCGFPSLEKYYYRIKINKLTIDEYLLTYKPINKLEKNTRYEVIEDSKGLKSGTIFEYRGYKDKWREQLLIVSGAIKKENNEYEMKKNAEYILFNCDRMTDLSQGTIPKCKVIN